MAWWVWILAAVVIVPIVTVILGLLIILAMALMPDGIVRVVCAMCGRHGCWSRRNSLGYHLCDDCAGGSPSVKPSGIEEFHL